MSRQSLGERAVQAALRCYPRWWRKRYGPDQEALVEDLRGEHHGLRSSAWAVAGSFLLGAVRARASGHGMPAVPGLCQGRARTAIIAASLPAVPAACAALLLFGDIGEFGRGSGQSTGVSKLSAAGQVVGWESTLLGALSLVFIIQLALAAADVSSEMRALVPRRRPVLVTAVIVAVVALSLLLFVAAAHLRPVVSGSEAIGNRVIHVWYSYSGHPLAAAVLYAAAWTGVLGGPLGGAGLLAAMAARCRFSLRALTVGSRRARVLALLQAGAALCALALVIALPTQPPIGADGGLIYRADLGPWTSSVLCAVLVSSALISLAATRAAGRSVSRAAFIA